MNDNMDKLDFNALLSEASHRLGKDKSTLLEEIKNGNYTDSNVKNLMSNKDELKKLLSDQNVRELLSKFYKK